VVFVVFIAHAWFLVAADGETEELVGRVTRRPRWDFGDFGDFGESHDDNGNGWLSRLIKDKETKVIYNQVQNLGNLGFFINILGPASHRTFVAESDVQRLQDGTDSEVQPGNNTSKRPPFPDRLNYTVIQCNYVVTLADIK
jgi:hypothetical protein